MMTDRLSGACSIELAVDDPRWSQHFRLDRIDAAALAAIDAAAQRGRPAALHGLAASGFIAVTLADDATLAQLNEEWRGKSGPTNVLSFTGDIGPYPPGWPSPHLGDVILAYETVLAEARDQAKPSEHHLLHLVTHGVLHLLGYDHTTAEEAADMEALEITLLAEFGIADPYAAPSSATATGAA